MLFQEFISRFAVRRSQYGSELLGFLHDPVGPDLNEVLNADPGTVWTLISDGQQRVVMIRGRRFDDAIGFFICGRPWSRSMPEAFELGETLTPIPRPN